jgi:aldehyde dehydrogenase (NAD+)
MMLSIEDHSADMNLQLENNTRALPTLLRKLLPESLESDIFTIISTTPSSGYLSSCLHVNQRLDNYQSTYSQLVSTNRRVIAVVDRTGDLNAAADDLVTARFAFGGTSPYAPDLVLVNEFVMKKFMELVLQRVVRYMATANGHANGSADGESEHKYRLL